ncbi:MAG: DUF2794 domain-containing protein [Alphaproteobacteria bacterium]
MVDEPIAFVRAEERPAARSTFWGDAPSIGRDAGVRFDRRELDRILNIYGRMVIAGEWRDYALDFTPDAAVFSVFRRASEAPFYSIEKRPKLRNRQGQFAVLAASGHVLKRGNELANVLRVFDRKLIKAIHAG